MKVAAGFTNIIAAKITGSDALRHAANLMIRKTNNASATSKYALLSSACKSGA